MGALTKSTVRAPWPVHVVILIAAFVLIFPEQAHRVANIALMVGAIVMIVALALFVWWNLEEIRNRVHEAAAPALERIEANRLAEIEAEAAARRAAMRAVPDESATEGSASSTSSTVGGAA